MFLFHAFRSSFSTGIVRLKSCIFKCIFFFNCNSDLIPTRIYPLVTIVTQCNEIRLRLEMFDFRGLIEDWEHGNVDDNDDANGEEKTTTFCFCFFLCCFDWFLSWMVCWICISFRFFLALFRTSWIYFSFDFFFFYPLNPSSALGHLLSNKF